MIKRTTLLGVLLVLACSTPQGKKNDTSPPIINEITALPSALSPNGQSTVKCKATDEGGYPLQYTWHSPLGTIIGSDSVVTWVAPDFSCEIYISCKVEDLFHNTAEDSVFVQVKADSSGTG